MPELPEVEITRRGIEPLVLGKTITGVAVRNPNLRQRVPRKLARTLVGQRVKRVMRRGKYLLFECDTGSLIVHLGMSGSLRVTESGTVPRKHDHVDLVFDGTVLRLRDPRRFGVVLWNDGDAFRHPLLARLGVEPLGEHFSPEFLYRATRGRNVGIKQLLMNASVMVGVGNIYANESLFTAGIHPRARSGRLSRARCERLVAAVREVLLAAIAAGGSSLRDFVRSDGSPGYFQQSYYVYDRAALPCRVCGAAIRVSRMGQRSSFFCATCQKK
ncbi:MAG: bifunctional DNA-formamidopyrimidine glycosylase/DNA-(apurinic or apyrimidinic site) lyase [Betaproteobacteria bacterium]|nr:MAG: bifunctional DNA-formamidopyrimidine glycosylase/DNA-(apurinic or apyrimidinic site) lyase [Betaproteobacteria bacterium]